MKKVLLLDTNHSLIENSLLQMGYEVHHDYQSDKQTVEAKIHEYYGVVIRSRFTLDKTFIDAASNLKFIARVGAGLENIDRKYAESKNITLISAPEGNRDAVGEHALGMLLSIMNHLNRANFEVKHGKWIRAGNRGHEIKGKTVGLIGYGNMGKAFAQRLKGFECTVICYDIKENIGDENAQQVTLQELFNQTDILSLHTPQTPDTEGMINAQFINSFNKNIYFLNTARGKSVVTADLVQALRSGKVKAAALDVLEYENASFENFFEAEIPKDFQYLIDADNVMLTPHIAGWTNESNEKMAQVIVDKIQNLK